MKISAGTILGSCLILAAIGFMAVLLLATRPVGDREYHVFLVCVAVGAFFLKTEEVIRVASMAIDRLPFLRKKDDV